MRPYLTIIVAAILAYLPVSCMLFSLKNDVVAIEYPLQHFLSESLRHGIFPTWFDSWYMGFPMQSILSWGVYSTPQMLTGFLFDSNIYVLNAEFLFFIITSGCCMFKLLKTHFTTDSNLSLLLSCCYMLSGFTVGSSQWLLYITGMTFIPLVLYFVIGLLKKPCFKYALLLAVSFYLFFTNVHIYLTVVGSYLLIFFLLISSINLIADKNRSIQDKSKRVKYLFLSLGLTIILCAAPAYYTFEVISYLARSQPLAHDSVFFQSNYLHPDGLSSLLLPLSAIKTTHFNTEGIVLDTYLGLLPILLLPASFIINLKQKNKFAWGLLGAAVIFLFISFGHLTPFRSWFNILPGMSNFRHPGVLRIFFIFLFILYLGASFKNYGLSHLLKQGTIERKSIIIAIIVLMFVCLITILFHTTGLQAIWQGSVYETIIKVSDEQLTAITAIIQLCILVLLAFVIYKKQKVLSFFIIMELILNTLMCTPFFTISSYSAKKVNNILSSVQGYPVQTPPPQNVLNFTTDNKNNVWPNTNIYRKEISSHLLMPGPLVLEKISRFISHDSSRNWLAGKPVVFINNPSQPGENSYKVEVQKPGIIQVSINMSSPAEIIVQQANFPGWKVYYNNKQISLSKNNTPFVSTIVPQGSGILVFKFEKPGVFYSAILLHLVVLLVIIFLSLQKLRLRWPSLS